MRDNTPQPKPTTSWWTTLPGFITAIAALTTAIGGFILVMHQTGRLSPGPNPAPAPTSLQRTQAKPAEAAPVAAAIASVPAAAKQAMIIRKNDEQIDVRPSTLQHVSTGEVLVFKNGQSIALDQVAKLAVIEYDDSSFQVSVVLTLMSGKTYAGSLDAISSAYGFKGMNEFGAVEVALSDIKSVDFGR